MNDTAKTDLSSQMSSGSRTLDDALKQQQGRHMGDLVGWNTHGLIPQDRARTLAAQHGIEDDLAFPKVTPNSAYRRAVRQAVKGGARDERRYEVVKLEEYETMIVHGFVRKDIVAKGGSGLSARDVEFATETKVAFDKDRHADGLPAEELMIFEDETHPIAQQAKALYENLCVVFRTDDIRTAFQRAFRSWAGVPTLEKGGYWWIPAAYAHKVRSWADFMADLGNSTVVLPLFDTSETIASLRDLTEQSVEAQLERLMEQLTRFSGKDTTRVSTLEARVERFDELRDRAELYERLLGHTLQDLRDKMDVAQRALVQSLSEL